MSANGSQVCLGLATPTIKAIAILVGAIKRSARHHAIGRARRYAYRTRRLHSGRRGLRIADGQLEALVCSRGRSGSGKLDDCGF